jgi:hypothetical protein
MQGIAATQTSKNAKIRKTWIRNEHLQPEFPSQYNKHPKFTSVTFVPYDGNGHQRAIVLTAHLQQSDEDSGRRT